MKSKDIQLKKSEVITEILCDCCGKSCKTHEAVVNNDLRIDNGEIVRSFEYLDLKTVWGYGSNKDMQEWTAQICESCVDKHLSFIKFTITDKG